MNARPYDLLERLVCCRRMVSWSQVLESWSSSKLSPLPAHHYLTPWQQQGDVPFHVEYDRKEGVEDLEAQCQDPALSWLLIVSTHSAATGFAQLIS